MSKITIKKIPDEYVYYNWKDQVDLSGAEGRIAIAGPRGLIRYGDALALDIIGNDYCDEDLGFGYEPEDELNRVLGGKWQSKTFRGYSQGDWATCWYDSEKVDEATLKEVEDYLMGKVSEFRVIEGEDEYFVFVPHDVQWKGKQAICEYLNIDPADATVLEDNGYEKVYKYKEIL